MHTAQRRHFIRPLNDPFYESYSQAAGRVAAMTGGETKQNPSQVVSRGFSVGLA